MARLKQEHQLEGIKCYEKHKIRKHIMAGVSCLIANPNNSLDYYFDNQPDSIQYIDYTVSTNSNFINLPDPIKDNISITYNGDSITNLSVIRIYIYNTTGKNLSNLQFHFEIEKKDKTYTLISNSFYGPKDYPKEAIHSVPSSNPDIYIYNVDSMNITDTEIDSFPEPYVAEFVFLGEELPELKVSTPKTGYKLRDGNGVITFRTSETNIFSNVGYYLYYNWKILTATILFFLFLFLFQTKLIPFDEKVAKYNFQKSLTQYLESLGTVELSSVLIETIVKTVEDLHEKRMSFWESLTRDIKALINKEKISD